MILYLDTSALVKVYIEESYSNIVRNAFVQADKIAISIIGYVEFHSAISRLLREKLINIETFGKISSSFKRNWNRFIIVGLDKSIIERSTELLLLSELHAFDSIHLASAESLKNDYSEKIVFGCFDKRLITAVEKIGMDILPNI